MRIGIVDDLSADRAALRAQLLRFDPHLTDMISEWDSGETFLKHYDPGMLDFLFLDMVMPGISGMDVARAVRTAGDRCTIIFTTTSRDFAVDGYTVGAAGYLVKPFDYAQLSDTLRRLTPREGAPVMTLPEGRDDGQILVSHILYCEMQGHYLHIYLVGGEDKSVRMTFHEITARLAEDKRFLVCCRGVLVNLDQVKSLTEKAFLLLDGSTVPIRQSNRDEITRAYAAYRFARARGEM